MNLYDRVLTYGRRLVAPMAGYPGLRLIGCSAREAVRDAEVQLEGLEALAERLNPDIVFTLMDISVEAESLGLEIDYFDRKAPSPGGARSMGAEEIRGMDIPDPESSGRMPVYLRVAEKLSSRSGRICGAYVTGPFTLLSQLMGEDRLLDRARLGDDLKEETGFVTAVVGEYAAALAERVDLVIVVDPAAGALDSREFSRLCAPYMVGIAGIIRASGSACAVCIPGDIYHILGEMALTGVEVICLDARTDLPRATDALPSSLLIMGNLDPRRVLELGSAEDVRWEVRRLLRRMDGRRNFILSTGGDVAADTPMRNLEAMMEEALSWRSRTELA